jgi:hypothetical protein
MTQGSINASNHSGLEREAPELSGGYRPDLCIDRRGGREAKMCGLVGIWRRVGAEADRKRSRADARTDCPSPRANCCRNVCHV